MSNQAAARRRAENDVKAAEASLKEAKKARDGISNQDRSYARACGNVRTCESNLSSAKSDLAAAQAAEQSAQRGQSSTWFG